MNVLGICGSPHAEGNSAYALRYALKIIEEQGIETTYITLAGAEIQPVGDAQRQRKMRVPLAPPQGRGQHHWLIPVGRHDHVSSSGIRLWDRTTTGPLVARALPLSAALCASASRRLRSSCTVCA